MKYFESHKKRNGETKIGIKNQKMNYDEFKFIWMLFLNQLDLKIKIRRKPKTV